MNVFETLLGSKYMVLAISCIGILLNNLYSKKYGNRVMWNTDHQLHQYLHSIIATTNIQ